MYMFIFISPPFGNYLNLNHTYSTDRKKYKFKQAFHKNKYLSIYTMPKFNVSFYSYSLIGMLDDVEVIIFDEVNYKPLNETKYKKRIYRVLILNFLMYFNKYVPTALPVKKNTNATIW